MVKRIESKKQTDNYCFKSTKDNNNRRSKPIQNKKEIQSSPVNNFSNENLQANVLVRKIKNIIVIEEIIEEEINFIINEDESIRQLKVREIFELF